MELSQIHPQPLSEQIRDMLRDRIISGDLSPGERLTETELANRLAVSRGPLREAVLQLTEDGLLVKTAYKGLRVRSVSQSELCELYSMRTTLEGFAFEEAWEKRSDKDFAELRRRYASLEASRQAGDCPVCSGGDSISLLDIRAEWPQHPAVTLATPRTAGSNIHVDPSKTTWC